MTGTTVVPTGRPRHRVIAEKIGEKVSDRGTAVRSKGVHDEGDGSRARRHRPPPAPARRADPTWSPYFADGARRGLLALGLRTFWDAYFAGRAAPLGRVPAEVVHAIFYNFADGEVARHIPRVWDMTTPEAAIAARERGSVAALRRILGDLADTPGLARAADLADQGGHQRPDGGTGPLRRAPDAPPPRRTGGPALARGHPAPRAPRRRPCRRPGHRGHRRDGGPCAHALSEGMPGRAVRPGFPPARRRSSPRSWTGCAPEASSAMTAGSPTPAGRPRSGSSRSPTSSPLPPTTSSSRRARPARRGPRAHHRGARRRRLPVTGIPPKI